MGSHSIGVPHFRQVRGGFMKALSAALCVLFVGFGCSQNDDNPVIRWSPTALDPLPPAIVNDSSFQSPARSIQVANQKVTFVEQKVGAAFVKDGNLYSVSDSQNNTKLLRIQNRLPSELTLTPSHLQKSYKLFQERETFFKRAQVKYTFLKDVKLVDDIRVLFDPSLNKTQAFYYEFRFLSKAQDQVMSCELWPSIEIQQCQRLSLHFEAPAWVFTLQNLDLLQEVVLPSLTGISSGVLKSNSHTVSSESPKMITLRDLPLRFSKEDPRFDQLQSYYWVDRGIQYAQTHLQLKALDPIEVFTFIGFPNLTNAAFAFRNQIRLGRGDGVTYSFLAQDPSVIIHEVGHVLFNQIAYLPTQGQGGSLNEAFADYFAATVINSPEMGVKSFLKGPYKRSLNQALSYTSISNKLYQDSLIVSSALWEIEQRIGKTAANELFLKSLIALGPATQIDEYAATLAKLVLELPQPEQDVVRTLLTQREWPYL